MKNDLNPPGLVQNLAALDDSACAAIDAEVARRETAGIGPDLSRYADPGPDPVGIDWAWATSSVVPLSSSTGPASVATQAAPLSKYRFAVPAAVAGLAAALLVAVSALLFRGNDRQVAMSLRATAVEVRGRGPEAIVHLSVENKSNAKGYVTVVGLAEARSPLHYEEGGKFIELGPAESRQVALPPAFASTKEAVVLLTATPAAEVVRMILDSKPLPGDGSAARERLTHSLEGFGHRWAGSSVVSLVPATP